MDAKERQEKIKEAIWQTLSESGAELSFAGIKRGIDARIPKVHKYFLSDGFKEKEWDLEIQEVLQELKQRGKVQLSGIDEWQLLGDFEGELGGFDGD